MVLNGALAGLVAITADPLSLTALFGSDWRSIWLSGGV